MTAQPISIRWGCRSVHDAAMISSTMYWIPCSLLLLVAVYMRAFWTHNKFSHYSTHIGNVIPMPNPSWFRAHESVHVFAVRFYLRPNVRVAHSLIERHCSYNWYLSSSSPSSSSPSLSWPSHVKVHSYRTRISIFRFIRNHFSLLSAQICSRQWTASATKNHACFAFLLCSRSILQPENERRVSAKYRAQTSIDAGKTAAVVAVSNWERMRARAADTFCRCNRL